ncbi:hypothetical protein [Vulcaniibacterium gelatinicum]|uniref:hypothetical protein n=1 Tax=Vulcaniibacterium gelatinicum TaxID=2598725 RepID=UPI0011CA899A|nr:hypothetical protein [Vulcaniibacterium gelatinicum]
MLPVMKRFRHDRLRRRVSLVAIAALLWSQLAFAAHGPCLVSAMSPAADEVAAAQAVPGACEHAAPTPAERIKHTICLAHCSQGGITSDVARVPPVPALPAMPILALDVVAHAAPAAPAVMHAPPPSWHRPTPHPAALLLI